MSNLKFIPSIVIGLGGTGFLGLAKTKEQLTKIYLESYMLQNIEITEFPGIKYLGIDTVIQDKKKENEDISILKYKNQISSSDYNNSLKNAIKARYLGHSELYTLKYDVETVNKIYKERGEYSDFIPTQITDAKVEATADGAGGFPINGKMSLVLDFDNVKTSVKKMIDDLLDTKTIPNEVSKWGWDVETNKINVFIITSFGGGTGRGTFLTFTAMIRELLNKKFQTSQENGKIFLLNYLPDCFELDGRKVGTEVLRYIKNNQYSAFKEIEHILTKGYKAEKFFQQKLGMDPNNIKIQKIVDGIINISPKSEVGGINSYDILNETVGMFLSFWIMGGSVGGITEKISNFTKIEGETPLIENSTKLATRKHLYSRIGFNHIRFPENELFEFAKYELTRKVCLDIIDGNLTDIDKLKSGTKDIDSMTKSDVDKLINDWKVLCSSNSTDVADFGKSNITLDDCEKVKVEEFSTYLNKVLAAFKQKSAKYKLNNLTYVFENEIKDIKLKIVNMINDLGLVITLRYINNSKIMLIEQLDLLFKKELKNEFNELLNSNSSSVLRDDKITTKNIESFKQALMSKSEKIETEELSKFSNSSKYSNIQDKITQIKTDWDAGRGWLSKKLNSDAICDCSSARKLFNTEIESYNNSFKKYIETSIRIWMIDFASFYFNFIDKLVDKLVINQQMLNGDNGTCVIQKLKNECDKVLSSIKDSVIISNKYDDFKNFVEKEFNFNELAKQLETHFNEKFLTNIIEKNINEGDIMFNSLLDKTEELLREVHYIEGKSQFTLKKYIENIMRKGELQSFGQKLRIFFEQADYLGILDKSSVTDTGKLVSNPNEMKFLFLDNGNAILKKFESFIAPIGYEYKAGLDSNSISIFKIHPTLPVFTFKMAQDSQIQYWATQNDFSQKKEIVNTSINLFNIRNHTSSEFLTIDEPFGTNYAVNLDAVVFMLNTGLHMGAFSIDSSKFLLLNNNPSNDICSFDKISIEEDNSLLITDYLKESNKYTKITENLLKVLSGRVAKIFSNEELLKNYFTNVNEYPIFHPIILEKVIKMLDNLINILGINTTKPLINFLISNQKDNKASHAPLQLNKNYEKEITTMEELVTEYPNFDLTMFMKKLQYQYQYTNKYGNQTTGNQGYKNLDEIVDIINKLNANEKNTFKVLQYGTKKLIHFKDVLEIAEKVILIPIPPTPETLQSEYAYSYIQQNNRQQKAETIPVKLDNLITIISNLSEQEKKSFMVWRKDWTPSIDKWTNYKDIEEIKAKLPPDIPPIPIPNQSEYAYSYIQQNNGQQKAETIPVKLDNLITIISTLSEQEKKSFMVWRKDWTLPTDKWTNYKDIEEIIAKLPPIPIPIPIPIIDSKTEPLTQNIIQSEYAYSYTQSNGVKKTEKSTIKIDEIVKKINTLSTSEKDSFKVWKKGWTSPANKWTQYREIEEISALINDIPDDEDDKIPDDPS